MPDFEAERIRIKSLVKALREKTVGTGDAIHALQAMDRLLQIPHPNNIALWTAITTLLLAVGPAEITSVRKYWAKDYKEFDRAIDMLKEIVGPIEEVEM